MLKEIEWTEREMSGKISGGTESMNWAPDWPKQSDKVVAGILSDCLGKSGA